MQLLSGQDSTGEFTVGHIFEAGSSKAEPGQVPSSDLEVVYSTWSEDQHLCGQRRLYGGIHFSKAVSAGEDLCTGIASLIVDRAELLKVGNASGALADFDDTSITVKARNAEKKGKKNKEVKR